MNKPKVCEILDVEIEEEFDAKNRTDGPFYINNIGYIFNKTGNFCPEVLIDIINGTSSIIRQGTKHNGSVILREGNLVWRIVYDANPHIVKDSCIGFYYSDSFEEFCIILIGGRKERASAVGSTIFFDREAAEAKLKTVKKNV